MLYLKALEDPEVWERAWRVIPNWQQGLPCSRPGEKGGLRNGGII